MEMEMKVSTCTRNAHANENGISATNLEALKRPIAGEEQPVARRSPPRTQNLRLGGRYLEPKKRRRGPFVHFGSATETSISTADITIGQRSRDRDIRSAVDDDPPIAKNGRTMPVVQFDTNKKHRLLDRFVIDVSTS